jgi:hypothetical protein
MTEQGDITGNYNKRKHRGAGPGHGSSIVYQVLDRVFESGPRKGQRKHKLVSKRHGWQGKAQGRNLATGAKAVGVGLDPARARDLDLESWLSPCVEVNFEQVPDLNRARARAVIMAAIVAGNSVAERIQAIARRAAVKQAGRLYDGRGVRPSSTSIEDAASDGVLGILTHVRRLDKLTEAQWASPRVIRILAMFAGRAAFRSLASWSVVGMTGDNTHRKGSRRQFMQSLEADLAQVNLIASSLDNGELTDGQTIAPKANMPQYDASEGLGDAVGRRAFIRWLFQVGLRRSKPI